MKENLIKRVGNLILCSQCCNSNMSYFFFLVRFVKTETTCTSVKFTDQSAVKFIDQSAPNNFNILGTRGPKAHWKLSPFVAKDFLDRIYDIRSLV